MQEICKIETLHQFVQAVNQIKLKSYRLEKTPTLLFRGQSDSKFNLLPSLARRPLQTMYNSWQMVERSLIQTAQQKFPTIFSDTDYPVILLAKLQHYGIYTRLLDLTANAFVALFFACAGNQDKDGEVFAFSANLCSAYRPIANAIADTYRLTENTITYIENYFYKAMKQPYCSRLLYPNWEHNMERGLEYFIRTLKRPIFIEAGNICERQKNQGGYFLLFPNKTEHLEDNHMIITDELIGLEKTDEKIVKRFIIPKTAKQELLNQLSRFGVTKEFLFSDNVDEVCQCVIAQHKKCYFEAEYFLKL